MKRTFRRAAFLLTITVGSAQGLDHPGSTALNFLKLDVGARQAALQGGGLTFADDVNAVRDNPAALGRLDGPETSFLYSPYVIGIHYEHLTMAIPSRTGTWGIQAETLQYGDIPGYDINNVPTGTVSASDLSLGVSWGRRIGERLAIGAAGRYLHEKLDFAGATAYAGDAGVSYETTLPITDSRPWRFGGACRNVGTDVRFIDDNAPLPAECSVGAGVYRIVDGLSATVEAHQPRDNSAYFSLGTEYIWQRSWAVRGGWKSGSDAGPGIGLGFGYRLGWMELDYAWKPLGDLGSQHLISLIGRWGSSRSESSRPMIRRPSYDPDASLQELLFEGEPAKKTPETRPSSGSQYQLLDPNSPNPFK